MRRLLGLGLVGLTGCANFCDTFFKARNVCRDQTAAAAVSAPVVMSGSVYGCSSPVVCSGPIATEVYSSVGCDCAGTVVMSPTCAGEIVSSGVPISGVPVAAPIVQSAPIVGAVSSVPITSTPITTVPAGAVQPETSADSGARKPHPLLNPIRWMQEHHRSKQ